MRFRQFGVGWRFLPELRKPVEMHSGNLAFEVIITVSIEKNAFACHRPTNMNEDNPFKAGPLDATSGTSEPIEQPPVSESQAAYNTMTDLVGGLNVRKNDNIFQAKFIFASVVLAAIIGALAVQFSDKGDMPVYAGALLGSFAGLVIGFFASGIVLMVYRGVRHLRGKHD